jgi:hypothetical protein
MSEDQDLARLFQELRRADEALAPRWNEVIARRTTLHPIRWSYPVLRVAVVILLLGAAAVMSMRWRRGKTGQRTPEPEATIAAWSSPTAWLLETPGRQLWSEVPVFAEKSPDPERAATTPPKGDRP